MERLNERVDALEKDMSHVPDEEDSNERFRSIEARLAALEKGQYELQSWKDGDAKKFHAQSGGNNGISNLLTIASGEKSNGSNGRNSNQPVLEMDSQANNVLRIVVAQERQEDVVRKVESLRENIYASLKGDLEAAIRDAENRMMRRRAEDMTKVSVWW